MKEEKLESKNVTYKENFRLPRWPVDSVPMIRRLFPEILEEKQKNTDTNESIKNKIIERPTEKDWKRSN